MRGDMKFRNFDVVRGKKFDVPILPHQDNNLRPGPPEFGVFLVHCLLFSGWCWAMPDASLTLYGADKDKWTQYQRNEMRGLAVCNQFLGLNYKYVDCHEKPKECARVGVKRYPTVVVRKKAVGFTSRKNLGML
eukprot:NODE_1994_length_526_cov_1.741935_g1979_i0.p1 GENE.NODE_1994_length_526_cov_1.741935_g1979_i0~~NODE_1994_length_526_cov_1.741935_g1979_i0.p1  ORF type:complete len:133 (+),score=6.75 NODE_1994_length_526_cov_1.741935_g1979_i0:111-509(+)